MHVFYSQFQSHMCMNVFVVPSIIYFTSICWCLQKKKIVSYVTVFAAFCSFFVIFSDTFSRSLLFPYTAALMCVCRSDCFLNAFCFVLLFTFPILQILSMVFLWTKNSTHNNNKTHTQFTTIICVTEQIKRYTPISL